jgi:membrane protein implicated in regulation of membrane protease activity
MWFRKIIFGILTLLLGLAALAFGLLCIVCLSLFLLWQGLSASVIMFAGLSAVCVVLAYKALKRAIARDKTKLPFMNRR